MVQVTNAFKQKIYAPERTTKARVSFEILDVEAYEDATISTSSNAIISRPDQIIDKVREKTHKYATFERDYFTLDGTSYIPPRPNESDSELGWYNDQLSSADGTYLTPPVLEFTFAKAHNSIGLTITFDEVGREYATDFRIEAFGSNGVSVLNQLVTGNQNPVYTFENQLENYTRIRITILKWAKPNRRAKIVEVDFGLIREYTGEKLINLKVLEELDLLAATVPSNELQFTLDNSDNAFNILNPDGIYHFIKPNQEMTASIGLLIGESQFEYIPMGKYYLTEWTVEEGSMTSTFVGRDVFTKIDSNEYTRLLQNTNLYDLAVDVLAEVNIEKFDIDESLKTINTVGFREKIKTREALQMIAMASKSVVRQGRDGKIIIEQFDELAFETGYVTFAGPDSFAGMTTPQTNIDYLFQAIDFENSFDIPKLTLAPAISTLVFKVTDSAGNKIDYKFLNSKYSEGIGYEIDNPLINTEEHAADIAAWSFREYNFTAEYQATWRQNPALECGNVILIEDSFGGKRKSRITKQEFNFAGYLEGITEAKGGI